MNGKRCVHRHECPTDPDGHTADDPHDKGVCEENESFPEGDHRKVLLHPRRPAPLRQLNSPDETVCGDLGSVPLNTARQTVRTPP
jgi:hypothetical protein